MSFLTNRHLSPRANRAFIQRDASVFMSADQTTKPEEKKPDEKPAVPEKKVAALA